jgi:hypothetical protein
VLQATPPHVPLIVEFKQGGPIVEKVKDAAAGKEET